MGVKMVLKSVLLFLRNRLCFFKKQVKTEIFPSKGKAASEKDMY